jgi:hypothetical protein
LAGGPDSLLWRELRGVLPPETFAKLALIVGHVPGNEVRHTWKDLDSMFTAYMAQQVALDRLRSSTKERYLQTAASFGAFLKTRGLSELADINRAVVEDFKACGSRLF